MNILFKNEFKIQNQVYNLIKYTSIFFVFCVFSATFINSEEHIYRFGIIFLIICIPLAFIGLSQNLVKPDVEDGYLEMLLTTNSSSQIIFAKFLALNLCSIISFAIILPISCLLYNIEIQKIPVIIFLGISLILLSSAITILMSSIQAYFRTNTNFLSILIMPLIIPNMVLSGMLIQAPEKIYIAYIIVGIDLIITPLCLYLSSHLLDNIYNI